jgi:MFS transporter, DHA2 family, methylenomycin A resistance protein
MPIVTGQVVAALGLLGLLAAVGTGLARPLLALLLVPLGVGLGFAVPSVTAAMLAGVAPERAGLAGGVFNSARQAGSALAVAVFGALVAHHATFLAGLRLTLLTCAVLLLATAAAALARPAGARTA